jgi:hypothetical protein
MAGPATGLETPRCLGEQSPMHGNSEASLREISRLMLWAAFVFSGSLMQTTRMEFA